MFLPYSTINPLTLVRVLRRLPQLGDLIVQEGDVVEPLNTIAQTVMPPEFCIINVSRDLSLSAKTVKQSLQVKVGDVVRQGAVLASRGGLSGRVCKAPMAGTITGFGRGRLLLEGQPHLQQLSALVPGRVTQIFPGSGAAIETVGAFIEGAWGNGAESYGTLRVVVRAARHPIRPKHIDSSTQGTIIVGGARLDEEALDQAIEMQVRGIIVGGVPPALMPRLKTVDFPVVATEGVGQIPMSNAAFKMLSSLDGREAAVCGRLKTRWGNERPYIVVPMPSQKGSPVNPETPLGLGVRVRALRAPNLGGSGTISNLPLGLVLLETGARLPGAQVDFDGEVAFVPFANLERLL